MLQMTVSVLGFRLVWLFGGFCWCSISLFCSWFCWVGFLSSSDVPWTPLALGCHLQRFIFVWPWNTSFLWDLKLNLAPLGLTLGRKFREIICCKNLFFSCSMAQSSAATVVYAVHTWAGRAFPGLLLHKFLRKVDLAAWFLFSCVARPVGFSLWLFEFGFFISRNCLTASRAVSLRSWVLWDSSTASTHSPAGQLLLCFHQGGDRRGAHREH